MESIIVSVRQYIVSIILKNLPLFIAPFNGNPGLIERIEIAVGNTIVIIILLFLCVITCRLIPISHMGKFMKVILSFFIFFPVIIRFIWDYAYDTPVALLCQVIDISMLIFVFYKFGEKIFSAGEMTLKIALGLSVITLISLFLMQLHINFIIPAPYPIINLVISSWVFISLWQKTPNSIPLFETRKDFTLSLHDFFTMSRKIFIPIVMIIIFIPFFFTPSVPGTDTSEHAEFIGYLFQGQSLSHVVSGIDDEWYSIRYPAGYTTLGWTVAHMLNIRATESILLIWIITYILLIGSLIMLANRLKISKYFLLLFAFNPVFFEFYFGGLFAKSLSFVLCVFMLSLLIDKKFNLSTILLLAATVIHPNAAFSFWFPFTISGIWLIMNKELNFIKNYIIVFVFIIFVIYIGSLATGRSLMPHMAYSTNHFFDLTVGQFINNILFDNYYFTPLKAGVALIAFIYAFFIDLNRYCYLVTLSWLLGIIFFQGLLGKISVLGGYFISVIWAVSLALIYSVIIKSVSSVSNEKTVQVSFMVFWIISTGIFHKFIVPSSLVTHSDIRMAYYIEKNLPENVLIANIRPPSDLKKFGYTPFYGYTSAHLRGNSKRNTIFSTLKENHQIKYGNLIDRTPYIDCMKEDNNEIFECFKKVGATHLFIGARPGTLEFVKSINYLPVKQIGQTYLYSLK